MDSKSLFETITTLHQTGDYRLRKIVVQMRDYLDFKELHVVSWIPVASNPTDVLTKRNSQVAVRLNNLLLSGEWNLDLTKS